MKAALVAEGVLLVAGLAAPAQTRVSVGIGVGPPAYYRPYRRYPYYGYAPPVIYAPPVVYPPPVIYAPASPPVVVGPPPPTFTQPPAQSWYYCDNPPGYYPHVKSCPTPWRPVPAR